MLEQIDVFPPHGFVRLDDCMADDLSVVNSARVSFAKRSDKLTDADKGLINYLMKNRHGTPFEHNSFRFNIRCPIFVAREWFRHRISSFNEESLRYSRARLDGYIPRKEDIRTQVGKPGAYSFEIVDTTQAQITQEVIRNQYELAFQAYEYLIDKGLAKELARTVLPMGIYTEFFWTINARALMNFLSLRNEINAQLEIRVYADAIEEFFHSKMPITYNSFLQNGRKAP